MAKKKDDEVLPVNKELVQLQGERNHLEEEKIILEREMSAEQDNIQALKVDIVTLHMQ